MLNYIKDLFLKPSKESDDNPDSSLHKLQIAACALLVEIANADEKFSNSEKSRITELMKNKFDLSDSEVSKIVAQSEESIKNSISLYEFTEVLNKELNTNEKYNILKFLWHIAYADGNLDTYEDHYIRKISNNLHLHNKDRIAAKLEVKKELGL